MADGGTFTPLIPKRWWGTSPQEPPNPGHWPANSIESGDKVILGMPADYFRPNGESLNSILIVPKRLPNLRFFMQHVNRSQCKFILLQIFPHDFTPHLCQIKRGDSKTKWISIQALVD